MPTVGIIPARYGSTRFPGKSLAEIHGKPMIQHVYERACRALKLNEILVATDDQRIFDAVGQFGGEAIMTKPDHLTGTDRLAEVAERMTAAEIIINIQGDEPLIDPGAIDAVATALQDDPTIPMCSVLCPLTEMARVWDANIVKVVTDLQGFALYFSRAPIPARRGESESLPWKRHLGLYGYRREFLLQFTQLSPTPLETLEQLEQLRALEHGFRIKMIERPADHSIGVDTPDDLERVKMALAM
ncbi:MAG: 3-deoxy-manno-octulosonate cytidylyltransferase [Armatimonadota bacterium]